MSLANQLLFAAITCFFSFGVQTLFFLGFKLSGSKLIKKEKTVFNYLSGVVGDGVLVPLTNIFAIQTLQFSQAVFVDFVTLFSAMFIGLFITFTSHFHQQNSSLTNWTMPKAGKWNTLGLYHAFFMFWETTFLGYVLISQIKFSLFFGPSSFFSSPIRYSFLTLSLFLLTFFVDYWKTFFKETLTNLGSTLAED